MDQSADSSHLWLCRNPGKSLNSENIMIQTMAVYIASYVKYTSSPFSHLHLPFWGIQTENNYSNIFIFHVLLHFLAIYLFLSLYVSLYVSLEFGMIALCSSKTRI